MKLTMSKIDWFVLGALIIMGIIAACAYAEEEVITYRQEVNGDEVNHFYNLDCSKFGRDAVYPFEAYGVGSVNLNCKYVEDSDSKIMQLHYKTFLVQKTGEVN